MSASTVRSNPPALLEQAIVRHGLADETGANYTRLLATASGGPNAGALFLTAEVYRDDPVFPVWRSEDHGVSWSLVAEVRDTRFGIGNRYQPTLLELPQAFGGWRAGTILLAGNAIPNDLSSTNLVIYASEDRGETWSFACDVDAGGPAVYDWRATSTTTAVWEPDLYFAGDVLVCAYADERHKPAGMLQVLAHRTTTDLRTWSAPVIDFGVSDRHSRPGMFVCTGRLPDGTFRAVFELVGPSTVPVHIASSQDGLDWGDPSDLGRRLVSDTGVALAASPNIAWRIDGEGRTNLLVTGRLSLQPDESESNFALLNEDGGHGPWRAVPLPVEASRSLTEENSGYSQSCVWAGDGALVQATTVRNPRGSHDIVTRRMRFLDEIR